MTTRPRRYQVAVRSSIEARLETAPFWVRRAFYELVNELADGPYPSDHPAVSPAKGSGKKHLYVAWSDAMEIIYWVMQDQPLISVVGVHWLDDPGGDDGEPEDWDFWLAA